MHLSDTRYRLALAALAQAAMLGLILRLLGFGWYVVLLSSSLVFVCVYVGHWLISVSLRSPVFSGVGEFGAAAVIGGIMGLCGGEFLGTIIQWNPYMAVGVIGGTIGLGLGVANAALWLGLRRPR